MGWCDNEHEMVKVMQQLGVPNACGSYPLGYQCDGEGGSRSLLK